MFKKMKAILKAANLSVEIAKLVQEYHKAESDMLKGLIAMKANQLKSKTAKEVFNGTFPIEAYEVAFKVKECGNKHFLQVWEEEMIEKGELQ